MSSHLRTAGRPLSSLSFALSPRCVSSRASLPWPPGIDRNPSAPPRLYAWTLDNLSASVGAATGSLPVGTAPSSGPDRRIFVLGVGNLGRLYASSLASLAESPPITLVVHRKALLEQWLAHRAIEITRSGLVHRATGFDVEWWTEEKPSVGPVREVGGGLEIPNLIIATKAPDALPQADRLRGYLGANSTVAFVQNGMNKLWPPYGRSYSNNRYPSGQHPNWVVCVTTHGVYSTGPFASVHASPADVAMGPVLLNPIARRSPEYLLGRIMAAPHLSSRVVSRPALWALQLEKLVVNSIINPLTAILRCKNGQIFANRGGDIEHVIDLLLEEASHVLQALVRHESTGEMFLADAPASDSASVVAGGDMSREGMAARFSPPRLKEMLLRVGDKVRDNISSMLQDVQAGKDTEISEFNGWLVDTAEYLGSLDVTSHRILVSLVQDGAALAEGDLCRHFRL